MRKISVTVLSISSICLIFSIQRRTSILAKPMATVQVSICPKIVSREEWMARVVTNHRPLVYSPTPYVVIHHGGIQNYCFTQDSCSDIVRSYQNLHIDVRRWIDIGYQFVIGEDGNVYEGRGWNFIGAHAPGYNTQSIGIVIIGDFSLFLPNKAALNALNSLIECGVLIGKIRKDYKVIGHRQAKVTECPGTSFYQYVKLLPGWTDQPIPIYENQRNGSVNNIGHTTLEVPIIH